MAPIIPTFIIMLHQTFLKKSFPTIYDWKRPERDVKPLYVNCAPQGRACRRHKWVLRHTLGWFFDMLETCLEHHIIFSLIRKGRNWERSHDCIIIHLIREICKEYSWKWIKYLRKKLTLVIIYDNIVCNQKIIRRWWILQLVFYRKENGKIPVQEFFILILW